MGVKKTFLSAEWRNLVMLNYEVDPEILRPHVPAGCELGDWQGQTFISVVGFLFLKTRVLGLAIPWHENFEEVNLRFYVRREVEGEVRRGVVFIKEIVPKPAIAAVARWLYGENYVSMPMRHEIGNGIDGEPREISYGWRRSGRWEGLSARLGGEPILPEPGSEESFITEHYWGYSSLRSGGTVEYRVEHPPWRVWRAGEASLDLDAAALYGPEFAAPLAGEPSTAFVAEGSPILVRKGALSVR